jgi:hypothetical protein
MVYCFGIRREKMSKRASLIWVVVLFVTLTGVASAAPVPPNKFRIEGTTTSVNFTLFPIAVGLKSEGKVIQQIQGTFSMNELLALSTFESQGLLAIETKRDDLILIRFKGTGDQVSVSGDFWVIYGTGEYAGLTGRGTYQGTADQCSTPCDPLSDLTCRGIYEPDCTGFYVDFAFDQGTD